MDPSVGIGSAIGRWIGKRLSEMLATRESRRQAARDAETAVAAAVWKVLALAFLKNLPLEERMSLAEQLDAITEDVRKTAELEADPETIPYLAQGARAALNSIKASIIAGELPDAALPEPQRDQPHQPQT